VGFVVVYELGAQTRGSESEPAGDPTPPPPLLGGAAVHPRADGPGGLGVGRLISPLLLAYLVALGYVVLGVLEGRESIPAEE